MAGRWVDAKDLRMKDELLRRNGAIESITNLQHCIKMITVYNIHVEHLHTYAIGRLEILTHNRAPEYYGGSVSESGFLDSAIEWLGSDYIEKGGGRYTSSDGMHQVRYGSHETSNPNYHHGHFEAYDYPGGTVVENTVVDIHP